MATQDCMDEREHLEPRGNVYFLSGSFRQHNPTMALTLTLKLTEHEAFHQ